MSATFEHRNSPRDIGAGIYVRLCVGGEVVMDVRFRRPGAELKDDDVLALLVAETTGSALLDGRGVHLQIEASASGRSFELIRQAAHSVLAEEASRRNMTVVASRFVFDCIVDATTFEARETDEKTSRDVLIGFLDELAR